MVGLGYAMSLGRAGLGSILILQERTSRFGILDTVPTLAIHQDDLDYAFSAHMFR